MRSAEHRELIPLVEAALAVMRLACEKFFVLVSVLAAYLLFRDDVPRPARALIRLNHRLSTLFQRVRETLNPKPPPSGNPSKDRMGVWCIPGPTRREPREWGLARVC